METLRRVQPVFVIRLDHRAVGPNLWAPLSSGSAGWAASVTSDVVRVREWFEFWNSVARAMIDMNSIGHWSGLASLCRRC